METQKQDNRTFEVNNSKDLNKFLAGVLAGLRRNEITVDDANALSKVADKINKNNIVSLDYIKATKSNGKISFLENGLDYHNAD